MRDWKIDVCRAVAVLLIVVLHAWGAASQYGVEGTAEWALWKFVGVNSVVGMYSLFVVSGFLMFQVPGSKFQVSSFRFQVWREKIWRRVKRLVVPYVCWNVVFVAFFLAAGRLFPRAGARVAEYGLDTWSGALAKIGGFLTMPIDFPLWYMRTIFVFALAAPVVGLALRSRVGRWIGLAVVGGCYLAVDELKVLPNVQAYPAFAMLLWYAGGMIASAPPVAGPSGAFGGGYPTRGASGTVKAGLMEMFGSRWWMVVGLAGFALDGLESAGVANWLSFNSRMILKAALFLHFISKLSTLQTLNPSNSQTLKLSNLQTFKLSNLSFFVYCGHFLFCSVWVHTLGPKLFGMGTGCESLLMFAFIVPGLALTIAVYAAGRKFCPKVLRVFDGRL